MKRIFSAVIRWPVTHWRGIISGLLIAGIAVITLGLQLTSLVSGQNHFETETLNNLQQLPLPWHRAVNAPYMLIAYFVGHFINNPLNGARITSVVFGLLAIASFYWVIKLWFNQRIAIVGSLLFITSSWLLNLTHQGAPFVALALTPLLAITPLVWYTKTKKFKTLAFLMFAVGLGVSAYTPLMPWLMLITLVVFVVKQRAKLVKTNTVLIIVGSLVYLAILAPLITSLMGHPGQLYELLGIPKTLPSVHQYFGQLISSMEFLIFKTSPLPELHLGTLPMLDAFSIAMLLLGIYHYAKKLPKQRSVILIGCLSILLLILPLNPDYQLYNAILLPFLYICITTGVVELLNRWFEYFPRNPWARNIGICLMVVAIGFCSFYHLQRYFIAWPNASETKAVYVVKSK